MKNKNPLYVVKGKTVLEAKGVVDMLLKRFNLEPLIEFLSRILNLLLAQVKDYPTLATVIKTLDEIMGQVHKIMERFKGHAV